MYNGQYEGGGDFMSLGLMNARVEFRFNVGSGPVVIASDEISLHTWHTLRFRKHRNTGEFFTTCSSSIVDDNSHCDIQPQDQGHPEPCCDIQILALA